jgi:hypothetical protein
MSTPVAYGVTLTEGAVDGVYVEISWSDGPGLFTIGTSTLGGTDELAGIFPLPNWTDVTGDTQLVQISRGRQDATSAVQASTCTATVVDTTGKYNAANPSSPLYGEIAPSRPMRVFVRYQNVEYALWDGVTSEVVAAPSKADPFATISGTDLLERLAQEEPVIAIIPVTTTGAAIGIVLDTVGWWGDRRQIPTGDAIINFSSDSAQTNDTFVTINGVEQVIPQSVKALDLINQILDHEGGIFFMSADGDACYLPYQGTQIVSATISDPNLITPGVSINTIYNRAQVTGSQGIEQEYLDGASAGKYGPRDVPSSPLTAQWLPDEAAAAILAERLVLISQTSPVWGLTLQKADLSVPANQAVYVNMLSLDIGDRITLDDPSSGTMGDYSIEGITHTIQGGGLDHETTWVLRMRPVDVFTIGQSVLGGTDTLGA